MSDDNVQPKKGLPWLGDWLKEHGGESKGAWQDSTTKRHEFRGFNARLVQPDTRSELQKKADDYEGAREMRLSNAALLEVLSVKLVARDRKRKGKLVEAWIRCAFLSRIVERVQPSRQGLGHERYGIAMRLLVQQGIAEPLPSGRDGYQWADGYKSILPRVEWLLAFARREGHMRKLSGPQRYELLD